MTETCNYYVLITDGSAFIIDDVEEINMDFASKMALIVTKSGCPSYLNMNTLAGIVPECDFENLLTPDDEYTEE